MDGASAERSEACLRTNYNFSIKCERDVGGMPGTRANDCATLFRAYRRGGVLTSARSTTRIPPIYLIAALKRMFCVASVGLLINSHVRAAQIRRS